MNEGDGIRSWGTSFALSSRAERHYTAAKEFLGWKSSTGDDMTNGTERGSGFGIAAMVLGIVGVILGWWLIPLLGFVLSILAIIFGGVGLRSRGRGMSIAGLVLGIITAVLSIIGVVIWGALMSGAV